MSPTAGIVELSVWQLALALVLVTATVVSAFAREEESAARVTAFL